MEAKEDRAMPFPYPKIIDRPMEAKEDRAMPFPYPKMSIARWRQKRTPHRAVSLHENVDRPIEHITTTRFFGKRHCRVRISSRYAKIIDRLIEHITTTRFFGKRHCRVRISWRTIAYNHRPIRRETALPCPNFCRVLISGNG